MPVKSQSAQMPRSSRCPHCPPHTSPHTCTARVPLCRVGPRHRAQGPLLASPWSLHSSWALHAEAEALRPSRATAPLSRSRAFVGAGAAALCIRPFLGTIRAGDTVLAAKPEGRGTHIPTAPKVPARAGAPRSWRRKPRDPREPPEGSGPALPSPAGLRERQAHACAASRPRSVVSVTAVTGSPPTGSPRRLGIRVTRECHAGSLLPAQTLSTQREGWLQDPPEERPRGPHTCSSVLPEPRCPICRGPGRCLLAGPLSLK